LFFAIFFALLAERSALISRTAFWLFVEMVMIIPLWFSA
jgi:hypothetical protein